MSCNLADPSDCGYYLPGDCAVSPINSYCPHLCGACGNSTTCTKICQNGANLNAQCICECYQNYNGVLCENLLCSVSEPLNCADFTVSLCTITQVYNYCPKLCGKCNSSIGTTFSSSTTTTTTATGSTTTTTTVSGSTTTTTTATGSTTTTTTVSGSTTTTTTVSGSTTTTTTVSGSTTTTTTVSGSTTTTTTATGSTATISNILTTCQPLACSYGQIQNPATCGCSCLPGFSGTLCQFFDCTSTITDPLECAILTCTDPSETALCPRQCSAPCASTVTTTTTSTTTGITTTLVTQSTISTSTITTTLLTTTSQCTSVLTCAYGQLFDQIKCQCNCLTGFSGTLCNQVDCTKVSDASECSLGIFDCSVPAEISSCPYFCGLCPGVG